MQIEKSKTSKQGIVASFATKLRNAIADRFIFAISLLNLVREYDESKMADFEVIPNKQLPYIPL